MQYENQKAACAEYAQRNGGSVADVLRTSGRKGAVVLSKDGRTIFDPFVIEPIQEIITEDPIKEVENTVKEKQEEVPGVEAPAEKPAAPKRRTPANRRR